HGAQAAPDQSLNLGGTPVDFAAAVAPLSRPSAAGQHSVLGRNPTFTSAFEPWRHTSLDARRTKHRRAAGLVPHASRRALRKVALDIHWTKLRGTAFG